MASSRIRALRNVSNRMTRTEARIGYLERRPSPKRLAENSVTAEALAPGAVSGVSIPDGSILNEKMDLYWSDYAPSLSGTGWALGDGTLDAAYCLEGTLIHFRSTITAGTTTTFGSASPIISLPYDYLSGVGSAWGMVCSFYDSSASLLYLGIPSSSSVSSITCNAIGTAGVQTTVTSTVPFTWATGDEIRLAGTYELG